MGLFNSTLWGAGASSGTSGTTAVGDILYAALRIGGVLQGAGHGAGPSMLKDALAAYNGLLGNWNTNRLSVPNLSIDLYTAIPRQWVHTIGPGGDFDALRPQRIERANVLYAGAPAVRRRLQLSTDADWASKGLQEVYSVPLEVYNDGGLPLSGLHFYPIPDAAYQVELYTWGLLGEAASADATVNLAPGYEEAITYNLAKRIAGLWRKQMTPEALEIAAESLAALQSKNSYSPRLSSEPGLDSGRGRGAYNYLTGSSS